MNRFSKRITKQEPNFDVLRAALANETPDYLPFYELLVDAEIIEAVLERPIPTISRGIFPLEEKISLNDLREYMDCVIEFYYKMGYDYVPSGAGIPLRKYFNLTSAPGRQISSQKRAWQDEHKGFIENWKDFENYKWPTIADANFSGLEYIASKLPEGMGIIAGVNGIFENVSWLPGIEKLCYMIYDEPDLVEALFNRIGSLWTELFQSLSEIDSVGALLLADDLGFYGGTFLPPNILRKHLFPWYKKIGSIAKKAHKPFVLHTCGNPKEIMSDLIDTGINAKHSFEDKIQPIWEAKQEYGEKIAVLGGIDMNILASSSEEETRRHVRFVLERCAGKGYALGSGNSIADYVKVENYLAMLDEGGKFRKRV